MIHLIIRTDSVEWGGGVGKFGVVSKPGSQ